MKQQAFKDRPKGVPDSQVADTGEERLCAKCKRIHTIDILSPCPGVFLCGRCGNEHKEIIIPELTPCPEQCDECGLFHKTPGKKNGTTYECPMHPYHVPSPISINREAYFKLLKERDTRTTAHFAFAKKMNWKSYLHEVIAKLDQEMEDQPNARKKKKLRSTRDVKKNTLTVRRPPHSYLPLYPSNQSPCPALYLTAGPWYSPRHTKRCSKKPKSGTTRAPRSRPVWHNMNRSMGWPDLKLGPNHRINILERCLANVTAGLLTR